MGPACGCRSGGRVFGGGPDEAPGSKDTRARSATGNRRSVILGRPPSRYGVGDPSGTQGGCGRPSRELRVQGHRSVARRVIGVLPVTSGLPTPGTPDGLLERVVPGPGTRKTPRSDTEPHPPTPRPKRLGPPPLTCRLGVDAGAGRPSDRKDYSHTKVSGN